MASAINNIFLVKGKKSQGWAPFSQEMNLSTQNPDPYDSSLNISSRLVLEKYVLWFMGPEISGSYAQCLFSGKDETRCFLYTRSLTANINTKFLQKIYWKNIEFADANKSLFLEGIIIYIYLIFIYMQILYQIGLNIKIYFCQFKLQLICI